MSKVKCVDCGRWVREHPSGLSLMPHTCSRLDATFWCVQCEHSWAYHGPDGCLAPVGLGLEYDCACDARAADTHENRVSHESWRHLEPASTATSKAGMADCKARIAEFEAQNLALFREGQEQRNRIAEFEADLEDWAETAAGLRERIAELEALLGEKTRRVAELETAIRQWEIIHAALDTRANAKD